MDFEKYFGRVVCKTLIISKNFVHFVNYLLKNRDDPAYSPTILICPPVATVTVTPVATTSCLQTTVLFTRG